MLLLFYIIPIALGLFVLMKAWKVVLIIAIGYTIISTLYENFKRA